MRKIDGITIKIGDIVEVAEGKLRRWDGVQMEITSVLDYEIRGKLLTKAPGYSIGAKVYFETQYLCWPTSKAALTTYLRSLVSVSRK